MEKKVISKKIKSPYPLYGVGITWLIYAMFFDLYELSDFLIIIGISIGVYLLLTNVFFKDKLIEEVIEVPEKSTGNPEFDQARQEANRQIKILNEYNTKINNQVINQSLNQITETIKMIFEYLSEHTSQVASMRKVLSYYLPTLINLLEMYEKYDDITLPSEQLKETLKKIEDSVKMVETALYKKYQDLYQDEVIDAGADISVLKTMLNQDGLLDQMKEEK